MAKVVIIVNVVSIGEEGFKSGFSKKIETRQ
jgi:hypothetical protein